MSMKYESAYFCGYSKLPSNISSSEVYVTLTLGLKIELKTGYIEDVSVTLLSPLAQSMVRSYFLGHHVVDDYDAIVEEITFRHQGTAAKSIIKAYGDVRRNFITYMDKYGSFLLGNAESE